MEVLCTKRLKGYINEEAKDPRESTTTIHYKKTHGTSSGFYSTLNTMLDLKAGGFFVPKSTFKPGKDIPDLSGKVIIVTGANVSAPQSNVDPLFRSRIHPLNPSRLTTRSEALSLEN